MTQRAEVAGIKLYQAEPAEDQYQGTNKLVNSEHIGWKLQRRRNTWVQPNSGRLCVIAASGIASNGPWGCISRGREI